MTDEQFRLIITTRALKIMDDLFEARIKARKKIRKAQLQQKWYYDSQHPLRTYEIGEKVLKYNAKLGSKIGGKLEEKWNGPYRVHEVLGNSTYKFRTMSQQEQV
ncbi:15706_t:CDS:1, partial [Gigaspora rosea]